MKPFRPSDPPASCAHSGDADLLDAETALRQVDEALAVLHALDEGALLGEPPRGREARRRHQSAVVLIDVVREKLERLRATLESCEDGRSFGEAPGPAARTPVGAPAGST